jgi:hypothetical protein
MSQELREYIEEKVVRKLWDATFRLADDKPVYTKQTQLLICINPITLELEKVFESIPEMEYDLQKVNLQPILNKYFKGKYKSPTICDYVVVPFARKHLRMQTDEFQNMIKEKAIDSILKKQHQEIGNMIHTKSYEAKKAYFGIFNTIIQTYTNKTNYEIKF